MGHTNYCICIYTYSNVYIYIHILLATVYTYLGTASIWLRSSKGHERSIVQNRAAFLKHLGQCHDLDKMLQVTMYPVADLLNREAAASFLDPKKNRQWRFTNFRPTIPPPIAYPANGQGELFCRSEENPASNTVALETRSFEDPTMVSEDNFQIEYEAWSLFWMFWVMSWISFQRDGAVVASSTGQLLPWLESKDPQFVGLKGNINRKLWMKHSMTSHQMVSFPLW